MQDELPKNIRGLRRTEYDAMVLAGILYDKRVELLDGQLVTKVTTSPLHSLLTTRLMEMLYPHLRRDMRIRVNMPFAASDDSEPEPDLAVVLRDDNRESHPEQAFLAIEVCYSSGHNDRVIKPRLYAGARIPEYWIVDVEDKAIEVYTQPRAGQYTANRLVERGTLTPVELPDAHIDLAALFA